MHRFLQRATRTRSITITHTRWRSRRTPMPPGITLPPNWNMEVALQ